MLSNQKRRRMFIQAHLAIACKPSLKVSGIWSCCFLYGSHTGTWLLLRCCVSSVLQTVWTQLGVSTSSPVTFSVSFTASSKKSLSATVIPFTFTSVIRLGLPSSGKVSVMLVTNPFTLCLFLPRYSASGPLGFCTLLAEIFLLSRTETTLSWQHPQRRMPRLAASLFD